MQPLVFTEHETSEEHVSYRSGSHTYTFILSSQMFRPSLWKKDGISVDDQNEIERAEVARLNYVSSHKLPIKFVCYAKDGSDCFFWDKQILYHLDSSRVWRLAFVGKMGDSGIVQPPFPEKAQKYLTKKMNELQRSP